MKFFRHVSTGFVVFSLLIVANLALSDPQVVFTGQRSGNCGIYLLEDLKDNPINLTQDSGGACWSPDGKKIAFVSDRDGEGDIYVMNMVTKKVKNITNNSQKEDIGPDWCPKEEKIAFIEQPPSDVYIADILTKEIVRVTENMHAYNVAWTPNGEKLAFAAILEGKEAIYSIDPYGKVPVSSPGECEVIVEEPPPGARDLARWGFSFSPDQTMIAFDAHNFEGREDIYTMNLSTGDFKNLTLQSTRDDKCPDWSPDGKFIAFSSSRKGSLNGDIYFMTPEGEIIEQLKFWGYDTHPDIFDPDLYSVSPLDNSKACIWAKIKR